MRTTQAKILTWVFIAVALTSWVIQARRSNPYLNSREVSVAQLAEEGKQRSVLYVGTDDAFHFFQLAENAPPEALMMLGYAPGDQQLCKIPKDLWTPPERRQFRRTDYLPVKVRDGKIILDPSFNKQQLRRDDNGSGEDEEMTDR